MAFSIIINHHLRFDNPVKKGVFMPLVKRKKNVSKAKPLNTNEFFAKVQKRAYELYEKRGHNHGCDWQDWFHAERQIKKELGIK